MEEHSIKIIIALVSLIIGTAVSFIFFRINRKDQIGLLKSKIEKLTNSNNLAGKYQESLNSQSETLSEIRNNIGQIYTKLNITEEIDTLKDLSEIKNTLETLKDKNQSNQNELKQFIEANYHKLKDEVLFRTEQEFSNSTEKLKASIINEVSLFIGKGNESEILSQKLIDTYVKTNKEIFKMQKKQNDKNEQFIDEVNRKLNNVFDENKILIQMKLNDLSDVIQLGPPKE